MTADEEMNHIVDHDMIGNPITARMAGWPPGFSKMPGFVGKKVQAASSIPSVIVDGVEVNIEEIDGVFLASSRQMPQLCVCHPDRQAILDDLPAIISAIKSINGTALSVVRDALNLIANWPFESSVEAEAAVAETMRRIASHLVESGGSAAPINRPRPMNDVERLALAKDTLRLILDWPTPDFMAAVNMREMARRTIQDMRHDISCSCCDDVKVVRICASLDDKIGVEQPCPACQAL